MHSGDAELHVCWRVGGNAGSGGAEDELFASLRSLRMEMVDKMKTSRGMTLLPGIFIVFFPLIYLRPIGRMVYASGELGSENLTGGAAKER